MRRRAAALTGAVLVSGVLASGCASHPPSTAIAVSSWASAAGFAASTRLLRTDVAEIGRGIARRDLRATHTACDGLGTDAANALGMLPTPDKRFTDDLNTAYIGLARAAQHCSDAGSFTHGAFDPYRRGARAALAALRRAEARYRALVPRGRRGAVSGVTG